MAPSRRSCGRRLRRSTVVGWRPALRTSAVRPSSSRRMLRGLDQLHEDATYEQGLRSSIERRVRQGLAGPATCPTCSKPATPLISGKTSTHPHSPDAQNHLAAWNEGLWNGVVILVDEEEEANPVTAVGAMESGDGFPTRQ